MSIYLATKGMIGQKVNAIPMYTVIEVDIVSSELNIELQTYEIEVTL